MFATRFHGRGGQGIVTAAELLSVAAFLDGSHAQAFPTFGSERTGAPVVSFCRIDKQSIRAREPIAEPDAVIVCDPTLLHQVDVFDGLSDQGYLLVNTTRSFADLGISEVADRLQPGRAQTLPASSLAREHLGRPLPNAALLGGVAALTGEVAMPSLVEAITERFGSGSMGQGNVAAAQACFDLIAERIGEMANA